ncbi:13021_t:CDS:1 [Ambispora gerdemannii]|uniref:13021_t:CDS:1 n=1 Tax=Ambispora gerdemannii TaxID=144530 RepID=A0A9N9BLD9_9GLOM|nr:13021_t:CDS:1 [Ambispora gerdemannii]
MAPDDILNTFILIIVGILIVSLTVAIVWCILGKSVLFLFNNCVMPMRESWKTKRQVSPDRLRRGVLPSTNNHNARANHNISMTSTTPTIIRMPVPAHHHHNQFYDSLGNNSDKSGPIIRVLS